MALLIVVAVIGLPIAIGFGFGIAKDGSPFRRSWWL